MLILCLVCKKPTNSRSSYCQEHKLMNYGVCCICQKKAVTKSSIYCKEHRKVNQSRQGVCRVCHRPATTTWGMFCENHKKWSKKRGVCCVCGEKAASMTGQYCIKHRAQGVCQVCGEPASTKTKRRLCENHLKMLLGVCRICGQKAMSSRGRYCEEHKKNHGQKRICGHCCICGQKALTSRGKYCEEHKAIGVQNKAQGTKEFNRTRWEKIKSGEIPDNSHLGEATQIRSAKISLSNKQIVRQKQHLQIAQAAQILEIEPIELEALIQTGELLLASRTALSATSILAYRRGGVASGLKTPRTCRDCGTVESARWAAKHHLMQVCPRCISKEG